MRCVTSILIVAAVAAGAGGAAAQTPSTQAVKAAAAATRAARVISLDPRNGSNVGGTVGLYKIGSTRTRIVVRLPRGGKYRAVLHPGSDCANNRTATQGDVALTPTNFSKTGAAESSTVIALPLERVRSNYVVDVRNANDRAALAAACGRLNR